MASPCSTSKSCASNTCTNASSSRNELTCTKSKSSCYLQRKKPVNPLSVSIRPPKVDHVRQRVRSARMLKIRSLQSQLNDANYHLMELAQENRALKSTQRRQDKALNNYEGVNADLPKLIQSHQEDNRVMQERNRILKRQLREVTDTLKARDEELLSAKDQLNKLNNLAKDKHLEERAQLRTSLNEAKELIKSYESEISLLNRKLSLEVKNCRHKVNAEAFKFRKCQEQLAQALSQNKTSSESTGRLLGRRTNNPSPGRKSLSNLSATSSKEAADSDVKLEPIKKRNSSESRNSLASPVEKIKARLSSGDERPRTIEDFNNILGKLSLEEEHLKKSLQAGIKGTKPKATKLETLVQKRNEFKAKIHKQLASQDNVPPPAPPLPARRSFSTSNQCTENKDVENGDDGESDISPDESPRAEEFGKVRVLQNGAAHDQESDDDCMSESEDVVRHHENNLQKAQREILRVQNELKDIDKLEEQIEKNRQQTIILKVEDNKLVDEIWNEEFAFRATQIAQNGVKDKSTNGEPAEGHGNKQKKDPIVALENKRKLLAALREIDNGNSLDNDAPNDDVKQNNNEIDSRKSKLMKELFG